MVSLVRDDFKRVWGNLEADRQERHEESRGMYIYECRWLTVEIRTSLAVEKREGSRVGDATRNFTVYD